MSRLVKYTYQGQQKTISFSFRQFHSAHEAVAHAEGINIQAFLQMERQLEQMADPSAVKNHRQSYFKKLGFEHILMIKTEKA